MPESYIQTPASTYTLVCSKTNDNAAAGNIGEFISATVPVGSAVSLTSGVIANVISFSLPAGDWHVFGNVDLHPAASTVIAWSQTGISLVSATMGGQDTFDTDVYQVTSPVDISKHSPVNRISIPSTTTVYLVTNTSFTVSTCSAYGSLFARRMR